MRPVILLTFANDNDDYLENLVTERKDICKALQNHRSKGLVEVEHEGNASLDDIFTFFDLHKDKIVIFHYGGHASGTQLILETRQGRSQKVKAGPLAEVIRMQGGLPLVFLNGCATREQVHRLLSSKVKAVIATSDRVKDSMASEFAGQFYASLSSGYNIEGAFNMAKSKVTAPEESSREIEIYRFRDVNWEGKETPATDPLPWGLYYAEDYQSVLKWKLPMSPLPLPLEEGKKNEPLEVNSRLIDTLSRAIAPYNPQMASLIEENQMEKSEKTMKKIRLEIVESMPLPLGEQLRRLFQNSTTDINRLSQLVRCHRKVVELLCFILLSQLWEEKFVNPSLAVNEDFVTLSKRLFEPGGSDYQNFDYIKLIEIITHVFKKNEIEYFAEEFSIIGESIITRDEFYKALLFMEFKKTKLTKGSINSTNKINTSCSEAEKHLGIIFEKLGFLVKYKLNTIKKIEVKKERHKNPRYLHTRVILKGRREALKDTKWRNDSCTDDNSVILLKTSEVAAAFLSLSPFIIDYNAFINENLSRLYFFSYQDPSDGTYFYRFDEDERSMLNISSKEGDEIKTEYEKLIKQFVDFKSDVLT